MIKLKAEQEIDRHKIVQQRQFPKRGRLLCRHRKARPTTTDLKLTARMSSLFQNSWYSNKSLRMAPSMVTLLHAKCPPPNGGDTRFANMYPPCEALPNVTKAELKDQKVCHSWELSREHIGGTLSQKEINDAPPTDHPIVRKHPETQTKCLF